MTIVIKRVLASTLKEMAEKKSLSKITINDLDSINRIYDSVVKTAYDNFVNKIMASGIKTQSEIFNVESFMKTLQFDINEVINILITQLEEKGVTREEAKQIVKEALNSLK